MYLSDHQVKVLRWNDMMMYRYIGLRLPTAQDTDGKVGLELEYQHPNILNQN